MSKVEGTDHLIELLAGDKPKSWMTVQLDEVRARMEASADRVATVGKRLSAIAIGVVTNEAESE